MFTKNQRSTLTLGVNKALGLLNQPTVALSLLEEDFIHCYLSRPGHHTLQHNLQTQISCFD